MDEYRVTINATGSPYFGIISSDYALDRLVLDSVDASINLNSGVLTIADRFQLNSGLLNMNGGTVRGGTLQLGGGDIHFSTSTNNRFEGVSIDGGNLIVTGAGSANLDIADGITLNGNAIELASNAARIRFDGDTTISDGTIFCDATSGGIRAIVIRESLGGNPATLTIASDAEVRGGRFNFTAEGAGGRFLVNQGLISADNSGQFIGFGINISQFTNEGTLRATNGGSLDFFSAGFLNKGELLIESGSNASLGGAWSNAGTIAMSGGSLTLGGNFATQNLGNFTGFNTGSITVNGTWDNTGDSFTFNSDTGSWLLSSGTIRGGTLVFDGAGLSISTANNNRLEGVSIQGGNLALSNGNARLDIVDGITLNGNAIDLAGSGSQIRFIGDTTISDGTIFSDATTGGIRLIQFIQSPLGAPATLTIASDAEIRGGRFNIAGSTLFDRFLVNHGSITADISGQNIGIQNTITLLTNEGTIRATNGGSLSISAANFVNMGELLIEPGSSVFVGNNWSNMGTISMNGGSLTLGGNFATSALGSTTGLHTGSISVSGKWDNSGDSFTFDNTTGSWLLNTSGAIRGGTLVFDGAGLVFSSSQGARLEGVSIQGDDLVLGASNAIVDITDGITLNGNAIELAGSGSRIRFSGDNTISGGTLFSDATSGTNRSIQIHLNSVVAPVTMVIANDAKVRGGRMDFSGSGSGGRFLINNGTITADNSGQTIGFLSSINLFTNNGTLRATNGGLLNIAPASFLNTGNLLIESGGSVSLTNTWSNAGTIAMTGGSLNLGGNFTTTNLGTITGLNTGNVAVNGTWDNTGDSFTFDNDTGSWLLNAGTIRGGTLLFDGAGLSFSSSTNNRLESVSIEGGNLVLGNNNANIDIIDGINLNGNAIELAASGSRVRFVGDTTLADATIFSHASSGVTRSVQIRQVPFGDPATLTIASDTQVRGGRIDFLGLGSNDRFLINQGAVTADINGQTIAILSSIGGVTNTGTFRAINGGILSIPTAEDNLTNFRNGVLTGGTYIVGAGSTLDFGDAEISINNAKVELYGNDSSFNSLASIVENLGSLTLGDGRIFNTIGGFSNAGDLLLGTDASMNIATGALANTGTLAGSGTIGGGIDNAGTLNPTGGVASESTDQNAQAGTLSINGDALLQSTGSLLIALYGSTETPMIDLLAVNGSAFLAGELVVDLSAFSVNNQGTYAFLTAESISGGFDSIQVLGFDPSLVSVNESLGTLTVIPAPSSAALMGMLGLAAASRRRRTR